MYFINFFHVCNCPLIVILSTWQFPCSKQVLLSWKFEKSLLINYTTYRKSRRNVSLLPVWHSNWAFWHLRSVAEVARNIWMALENISRYRIFKKLCALPSLLMWWNRLLILHIVVDIFSSNFKYKYWCLFCWVCCITFEI